MSGASARSVAFDVVHAVSTSDAYANLLLPVRTARAKLDPADAAFATELAYGTLRMRGYYDAVIALAAKRDVSKIDPPVLDALRLGVHQLLGMRTAQHAAVDETVSLVRAAGKGSATGFANGVLRAVTRTSPDGWRERVLATATDADSRLALEHSHPAWVVRALRSALAAEGRAAELPDLLAADNVAPRVGLVALPGLSQPAELPEPGRYAPTAGATTSGDPARIRAVGEGRARVQDEGSQLAALALSRARPIERGERWLDLCAGPGGKAALLGAEAARGGATLVANELVPQRADLVRQALSVLDPAPEVRTGDGTELGFREPGGYDRVLLDAPCTGLGALRRRPEARWRKQPKDVPELSRLQDRLLDSAIAAVRPGGIVAYVTCSPHPAETTAVVQAALDRHAGTVEAIDTPAVLDRIATAELNLPRRSSAQLWPHRHATDAMFIQLLGRVDG